MMKPTILERALQADKEHPIVWAKPRKQKVPLTPDDLAELERRKANAKANRVIMALREELKGLKLAIGILKQALKDNREVDGLVRYDPSIDLLKAERDKRLDEIKQLEASKRKKGEDA